MMSMGDGITQKQRSRFSLTCPGFESHQVLPKFSDKWNFEHSDLRDPIDAYSVDGTRTQNPKNNDVYFWV